MIMTNNRTFGKLTVGGVLPPLHADAGHYLRTLLKAGEAAGRISPAQAQNIRHSLDAMLTSLAVTYTFGASASMPAETARRLFDSAAYAIGLTLKSAPTPDAALEKLLSVPPDELRRNGILIIDTMTARAAKRLELLQKAPVTTNRAYLDTVRHGLPLFFSSYDKVYAAHESPGSIDYPLCMELPRLTGIEYADAYIEALSVEALFLSRWPQSHIDALLRGYSAGWRDLLINAYLPALTNALGRTLCSLDLSCLVLSANDRASLSQRLTGLSAQRLRSMLGVALGRLPLDASSFSYARRAQTCIAASIRTALDAGHPEAVFISPAEPPVPPARFVDGPRMSDEDFRMLIAAVRECHTAAKAALVLAHVKSLSDLTDLLGADVLSGREFNILFDTLDTLTLTQLAALIPEDNFHSTAAEQAWHTALKDFLISRRG
jgi:hypothetical protein